jgi:chorismate mutase
MSDRSEKPAAPGPSHGDGERTLDELRRDIDRVDEVLVRLLNERARCACEIGRLKKAQGVDVYQPEREKHVFEHVRSVAAEGPLGPEAIVRLFERIIDEARRLERRVVHDEFTGDERL